MCSNLRYILDKLPSLHLFLCINSPDINLVKEAWLNDCVYDSSIELSDYHLFHHYRALGVGTRNVVEFFHDAAQFVSITTTQTLKCRRRELAVYLLTYPHGPCPVNGFNILTFQLGQIIHSILYLQSDIPYLKFKNMAPYILLIIRLSIFSLVGSLPNSSFDPLLFRRLVVRDRCISRHATSAVRGLSSVRVGKE